MPQLVLFKRNWSIGSDDFVYAGSVDCLIRIVWFVVVIVIYLQYKGELDDGCKSADFLHAYFIVLLVFLAITVVLGAVITHYSMKGTIANSRPRQYLPILLYLRLFVALLEIILNILGTYLAFVSAADCHRRIVDVVKGTAVTGWIIVFILILTCLVVFNLFNGKTKQRLLHRMGSFQQGSRRHISQLNQWEKRCKCMFFCADGFQSNRNVFSTLAELSADYFKGVDLVPTDVIAGLIVLSHKKELQRQQWRSYDNDNNARVQEDPVNSLNATDECTTTPQDWMTLDNMSHYLEFAIGSYGWLFFVTLTNPVIGACSIFTKCRCCRCRDDQSSAFDDNCCMCNTAAFKKTTGVSHEDIVFASFKNEICEIPFYVVIDRRMCAVVVAIRGTLSLQDVITDLVVKRQDLPITDVNNAYAHKGIFRSANYISTTLEKEQILEKAFLRAEGNKELDLVITGHSLGAGTAAILAILLKPKYPRVRCFAYAPPGELVSPDVSAYAKDIVCSVVLGDDMICRMGMVMMNKLKLQILTALSETRLPKYKILASGCWRMCCGRAGLVDENIQNGCKENGNEIELRKKNRCSLQVCLEESKEYSENIQRNYQPLQLPGQILYIEKSTMSGDSEFRAMWKNPQNFTEIIVSPDMLAHHFPDKLLEAINDLRERNFIISLNSETRERGSI